MNKRSNHNPLARPLSKGTLLPLSHMTPMSVDRNLFMTLYPFPSPAVHSGVYDGVARHPVELCAVAGGAGGAAYRTSARALGRRGDTRARPLVPGRPGDTVGVR